MNSIAVEKSLTVPPVPPAGRPASSRENSAGRAPDPATTKYQPTVIARLGGALFFLLMGFAVFAGWRIRDAQYLTAESGPGYMLGIIGVGMMALLMLYPLRKRARFMASWGAVKYWFRVHMMLGVLGPVCILFHSNFHLGSMNSNLALFSMLLVSGSGLVGRFLYIKIHYGLYGSRITLKDLRNQVEAEEGELNRFAALSPYARGRLVALSDRVLHPPRGMLHGAGRFLMIMIRTSWAYFRLGSWLKRPVTGEGTTGAAAASRRDGNILGIQSQVRNFLGHIRRVAEFSFYERMFSLWHLLHLPLFVMMLFAAIFHVIAVHAY